MKKEDIIIKIIPTKEASDFVAKHHYRKIMPKLNKVCYGGFIDDKLVALITLGFGTQPMATIKKIFGSLGTNDYFEIGRMCLLDDLLKNSETYFMSRVFDRVKIDFPSIKVIFSWSDGIMGRPGFVYQACNFLYADKIKTDIYITKEGYLVHPRSAKALLDANAKYAGKEKLHWLTNDFMELNQITRLKGFQFRYLLFICDKRTKRDLIKESKIELNINYPKTKDIKFYKKTDNKYNECEFPKYKETLSAKEVSRLIRVSSTNEGLVQFQDFAQE